MKGFRKLIFAILFACMAVCAAVLVCALVPGLSDRVALLLYGDQKGAALQEDSSELPEHVISSTDMPGIQWESMPFRNYEAYAVPSREELDVPRELLGRNGYTGIQAQISEAGEEEKDPYYGALGEEYTFSQLLYPYYAMLRDDMKSLYRQLYANALEKTVSFTPVTAVSTRELQTVFEALIGDHPELFWLDTCYQCARRGDMVTEITLRYYGIADRLEGARAEFELAAERILTIAQTLETEAEQEAYVHDQLLEQISYRMEAPLNQSAYSALVGGESVCAGYARAFQYLMQKLGIPCYYCMGYAGEDHAWNILLADGQYRNVDVTWDDTPEGIRDYYNQSDQVFSKTHMRRGLSVYLPACPEDGETEQEVNPMKGLEGLINPNPIRPITMEDSGSIYPGDTQGGASGEKDDLSEAGIQESEVMRTLTSYYLDCEKQLVQAGSGQVQFSNCIPVALWESIESAYSSGAYMEGYGEKACKELNMEHIAIHLQAVRLGGGYYRLYHAVATW